MGVKVRWLNNAIAAMIVQIFLVVFLGAGVIRSGIIFLVDSRYLGIFSFEGAIEDYNVIRKTILVLSRPFLSGWEIFLAPQVVIYACAWVYVCVAGREVKLLLTARERRVCINATYVVPGVLLVFAVLNLPSDVLFSGPIYGFHPLSPTVRMLCALFVPIIFWRWVDAVAIGPC